MPDFGVQYLLGVDGVSLFLVLLTTLLTPLVVLAAFGDIHRRVKEYMILMLVLETGMLGALVALDLFLFYVFWEVMLVPMYLLIGVWGGPRRVYAAIKFVLYTMVGSLLMLVAILYLSVLHREATGAMTFDLLKLYELPIARHDAALALRRLRARVRDQGADVSAAHLAAGRARRGADRRLGDPRRRASEDGDLRIPALRLAALPRGRRRRLPRTSWRWP